MLTFCLTFLTIIFLYQFNDCSGFVWKTPGKTAKVHTSVSFISSASIRSWFFLEFKGQGSFNSSILDNWKSPAPETWTWQKIVRQLNTATTIEKLQTWQLPADWLRDYGNEGNQWEAGCIFLSCPRILHQPVIYSGWQPWLMSINR